jgi:transposase
MIDDPPIAQDLWDQVPPPAQAAILAVFRSLELRTAALEERLGLNSSNSSKPPSSDPPHLKRRPPIPPSGKKRGGQHGHKRSLRPLLPPEQLAGTVDCKPEVCSGCRHPLGGDDPEPVRHQVAELPEIRPTVVEYRIHRLTCPHCGGRSRGELPAGVPRGAFGPRLQATVALLGGVYRLSKRRTATLLSDLLGLSISSGMVCKAQRIAAEALATPVEQIDNHVRSAPAAGVDETGWKQTGKKAWLWVAVTPEATAFRIEPTRGADALHALVGEPVGPVLTCDRFSTYARAPNRQTCWAHLRRDFQAMIDRQSGGEEVGAKLLGSSRWVFAWWRRFESGSVQRPTLRSYVSGLKAVVRLQLIEGVACSCPKTAKLCRRLLANEAMLWRFATAEGVPPHNNAAERALRSGVIWRKTSFGTNSPGGSRFVARMLSVGETCRQQGRHVLTYLTNCMKAQLEGQPAPALLS